MGGKCDACMQVPFFDIDRGSHLGRIIIHIHKRVYELFGDEVFNKTATQPPLPFTHLLLKNVGFRDIIVVEPIQFVFPPGFFRWGLCSDNTESSLTVLVVVERVMNGRLVCYI